MALWHWIAGGAAAAYYLYNKSQQPTADEVIAAIRAVCPKLNNCTITVQKSPGGVDITVSCNAAAAATVSNTGAVQATRTFIDLATARVAAPQQFCD